jgi:hypothetical protein
MTETQINYDRKIQAPNYKVYDEVYVLLDQMADHREFDSDVRHSYVFFDKAEMQVAKFDREERTVELSSSVDLDISNSIEHIIRTEVRGSD